MTALPVLHGPWSHSRASACSLSLYKEKVLKAPPEPRPERLVSIDRRGLGSMLHEAAEFNVMALANGEVWPDQRQLAGQIVASNYQHLAPEIDGIERRLLMFRDRFRVDRDMDLRDRDKYVRERVFGHEMRLAVDGKFAPLPGDKGFDNCPPDGWRGIIDYAEVLGEGHVLILDYKNRPAMFSDGELKTNEQVAGVYPRLFRAHYPQFNKFSVGIYYFEFGVTQIIEVTAEDLDENFSRTAAQARHKESLLLENIGPEPGFGKCQYCDYIGSCEPGTKAVEPGMLVPTDMASARDVGRWLIVNEEKVKAARSALRAFTAEHGPVVIDEQTAIGHALNDKTDYDKAAVLKILKEKGLKPTDFVNLDKRALAKIPEEVSKALEPTITRYQETEFEIFRAKKKTAVKVEAKSTSRKVAARVKGK